MDLLQLLTRRPVKSVMEPDYVGETDASQPVRGLLKALMERSVDVPAAAINQSMPAALVRALTGARMPVPSEQTPAAMGAGPGYEFGRSLPDTVVSALLLANPAASAARRAPANQVGAIKVYHGSPHKFDKFDSSKIGTGEGAQAYGHGGYFAEEINTAKQYATDRSHVGRAMSGTPDATEWDATKIAQKAADVYGDNAAAHLQNVIKANSKLKNSAQVAENSKVAEALSLIQSGKVSAKGNLYEASLRWPDPVREARDPLGPQHFLDWDKPLSQQPEIMRKLMPLLDDPKAVNPSMIPEYKGKDIMSVDGPLAQYIGPRRTQEEYRSVLRSEGIPGVTYLDAGSRTAGEGTRNFVTFSDDLIELLKRNGLPLRP